MNAAVKGWDDDSDDGIPRKAKQLRVCTKQLCRHETTNAPPLKVRPAPRSCKAMVGAMTCTRGMTRKRDTAQAELFAMAKQIAGLLLPAYYDGTQLAAAEVESVRETIRAFIEKAFEEVLEVSKAEHDCKQCETGFRVSTLYPAVEICIEEFKRLWKEQLSAN